MSNSPTASRWRAVAIGIVVVLLIVLGVKGLRKGGAWDPERFNDTRAYHIAAKGAFERDLEPAYHDRERPYQYPPTLATLLAPWGSLPYRVAAVIWVLLKVAIVIWVLRILPRISGALTGADVFLGFLVSYRFLDSDFGNGNANVIVLGVVVLGLAQLQLKRDVRGGVILALAACIKATPLLFLPWLIVQRRWKTSLAFAGGMVLWGAIVPVAVLGGSEYSKACTTWYEQLVAPMTAVGHTEGGEARGGYLPGQSLRAMAHRLLRPIDASAHDDEHIHINWVTTSKSVANGVYLGVVALCLGVVWWRYRRRPRHGFFSNTVVFTLSAVVSPLARKAAFVAILPAAVAARSVVRRSESKLLSTLWWLAFAAVTLTAPAIVGRETATLLVSYCPASIAALLVCAVLVLGPEPAIARPQASPAGSGDEVESGQTPGHRSSATPAPTPPEEESRE